MAKLADNIKLFRVVKIKNNYEELQKDLLKLSEWATQCPVKFNIDMFKAMHVGINRIRKDN